MALLHVDYHSCVLDCDMQMDVILPEQTTGQIGMEGHDNSEKWKTLYLLHGMSDDHTIWQRRTSIERYAAEKGIAVVMPTTRLGWYTDMAKGPKYFTATAIELPQICRRLFPRMSDRREDTYAAGLSMGGYGALKFGLRAPQIYSRVASLSGAADMIAHGYYGNITYWESIFGPYDQLAGSFNDLMAAATELKDSPIRPDVYMWCGTEDGLLQGNHNMRDHLNALGYSLIYEESAGDHQWKYWDEKIQTVLNWLTDEKEA